MSEDDVEYNLRFSHSELVALFMLLRRDEADLDSHQIDVYDRVRSNLYRTMSVAEMEDVESYYNAL